MTALYYLIPIALFLGLIGLILFFWTVKSGQYEDLEGDAARILYSEDKPIVDEEEE
ncbi:MAG TPA: cbb3-type cytochrome oxidase assembly protein CcoS [Hellea balneolensis]|uniref:Cbb3-type cytochrome oxidase assembly protein CcoS n=1 Tax=Hellea balneolensis TaxID=287478 RepID=A0A7V5NWC8_9PROT|nr:cbb3-type cytochrome oxidase assembly protein CcoS [Hellea balneolensis]